VGFTVGGFVAPGITPPLGRSSTAPLGGGACGGRFVLRTANYFSCFFTSSSNPLTC
jgi:hypothetical protein